MLLTLNEIMVPHFIFTLPSFIISSIAKFEALGHKHQKCCSSRLQTVALLRISYKIVNARASLKHYILCFFISFYKNTHKPLDKVIIRDIL